MKIRNGFISNSSSSSFTCDVCGNTESGRDMGLSDFDMSRCGRGHTFCNGHRSKTSKDISVDVKRKNLIDLEKGITYRKQEETDKKVALLEGMTDEEISDEFEENQDSYDVFPCLCPICTMEKMADYDALQYLLVKNGLTRKDVLSEVKARFNNDYQALDSFIRPTAKS